MTYYTRGATLQDPLKTAHRLREADVEEMKALGYDNPLEALTASIAVSQVALVDCVDESPECFAGVTEDGVIWCVTTKEYIEEHPRRFMKVSKDFINSMQKLHPLLWNYVYHKNTKHIRWIDAMGFKLEEPEPLGINNQLFIKFTRSI